MPFALSSCCKDDNEDERWDHPGRTQNRTIVIYMAAENSLASFVAADSIEMAAGLKDLPDSCRVVLFIDDDKDSRLCVGTREHPFEVVHRYDRNLCSTDSADMELVLTDIYRSYPAHHYGLILWSHASGWVFSKGSNSAPRRTFGIDNGQRLRTNEGPQMNIPTMSNVLSHHPHQDFIFFDACFMQCVEVAYELREQTDWVMGSPAEIPADGAPYDLVIGPMASFEAPEAIVKKYHDYYMSGRGQQTYRGVILSAIKTAELTALAAATKPLLRQLLDGHQPINSDSVQRYFYWPSRPDYLPEFLDMGNLFYIYCDKDDYTQWLKALDKAVPYRYVSTEWSSAYYTRMTVTDPDHCAAVSMFVPTKDNCDKGWTESYQRMEWYNAVGMKETEW